MLLSGDYKHPKINLCILKEFSAKDLLATRVALIQDHEIDLSRWYTYDIVGKRCYLKAMRGYQRPADRRNSVISGAVARNGCGESRCYGSDIR